jgi:hypothetical protein
VWSFGRVLAGDDDHEHDGSGSFMVLESDYELTKDTPRPT